MRALILLNTQAGTEDPEVIPLYQGMIDAWCADGPSDELCGTTASIILTDPDQSKVMDRQVAGAPQGDARPARHHPPHP